MQAHGRPQETCVPYRVCLLSHSFSLFPLCSVSSPLPALSLLSLSLTPFLFSVFFDCLSLPLNHPSSSSSYVAFWTKITNMASDILRGLFPLPHTILPFLEPSPLYGFLSVMYSPVSCGVGMSSLRSRLAPSCPHSQSGFLIAVSSVLEAG